MKYIIYNNNKKETLKITNSSTEVHNFKLTARLYEGKVKTGRVGEDWSQICKK